MRYLSPPLGEEKKDDHPVTTVDVPMSDNDGSDRSGGGYGDFLAVLRAPAPGASTTHQPLTPYDNSRAADDNNAVVDECDVPISNNGGGRNNYRRASMESEQTDSTKALHYSMNSEDSEILDMTQDRLSLTVSWFVAR